MEVTVEVPDQIVDSLGGARGIERALLESLAADAYRDERISRRQLRDLLGLDYWQTEEFLTAHDAKRVYSMTDLEVDRASLSKLSAK